MRQICVGVGGMIIPVILARNCLEGSEVLALIVDMQVEAKAVAAVVVEDLLAEAGAEVMNGAGNKAASGAGVWTEWVLMNDMLHVDIRPLEGLMLPLQLLISKLGRICRTQKSNPALLLGMIRGILTMTPGPAFQITLWRKRKKG